MKTTNHECYVSLEVAKLLKEAGFDWEITSYYVRYYEGDGNDDSIPTEEFRLHIGDNTYCTDYNNTPLTHLNGILHRLSAPTLEVAQKWMREVKKLYIEVQVFSDPDTENWVRYGTNIENSNFATPDLYKTYEEAQEAGIKKALEMILEKGE